jgi:hypothetical protein
VPAILVSIDGRFNGSERMNALRSNLGELGGRYGGFRRR